MERGKGKGSRIMAHLREKLAGRSKCDEEESPPICEVKAVKFKAVN